MNDESHGLSGAYAVDALDGDQRVAFEAHLGSCAECREEVRSLRAATAELAQLTDQAPPPAMKGAVLQGIRSIRPLPPVVEASPDANTPEPTVEAQPSTGVAGLEEQRARRRPLGWLVAAAAAVLLAAGGLAWSPWDDGTQPAISAADRVMHASDAQHFTKQMGAATTTVVRSRSMGQAVLLADHMAAAPEGRDYQVWLQDASGHMNPAGLLPHSTGTSMKMLLQGDTASAKGVGITLEPAGGSRQPTSQPLVLFELT